MEQKALGLPLSSPELNTAQGDKQTRSSARFKYELDYFFSSTNIKSDLASGQRETERGREEESEKQTARKGGRDEAKFGRSFRTRKIQCSLNSSSGGVSQCSC